MEPSQPKVIASTPVFEVMEKTALELGIERFCYVKHPGAVAVLPYDGENVYLTRQWRPAVNCDVIEPCAGTAEKGEHALATAQRELVEELGYAAHDWTFICNFFSSPGYTNELVTLYAATDLTLTTPRPEDTEKIEIEQVPVNGVVEYLKDRSTQRLTAKAILALLWFDSFIVKGWEL